jgi:acetyl-CoA carboxylase biotin carboxyl carrier protein
LESAFMHLRPEDVQDIVSLLDSVSYDEFEIRTTELHVTVRRAGHEGWTQESRVLSAPNVVATDLVGADTTTADSASRTAQDPVRPGLIGIRAPLPGTFYRAPKPGANPYVEVGSHVVEDTVVGLLETMKLFNSVHANVRGEVVEFLIDDAEPADQDAVLILVRPDVMDVPDDRLASVADVTGGPPSGPEAESLAEA